MSLRRQQQQQQQQQQHGFSKKYVRGSRGSSTWQLLEQSGLPGRSVCGCMAGGAGKSRTGRDEAVDDSPDAAAVLGLAERDVVRKPAHVAVEPAAAAAAAR